MAGIAQIAQSANHRISGCDANAYPPMSTLLKKKGIDVRSGYDERHIDPDVDQVIIGNALSRGNVLVEAVLNNGLRFQSGPGWLHDQILVNRQVVAVAGTHGKTTTSSMVTWMLQVAGKSPGFLIGGKPGNFDNSAQIGTGEHFVIEADEYDTAFFDKRSKFVHYSPNIAILNNLEFDHADIFSNLDEIKTQFHHLIRLIPQNGHIVLNADDQNLKEVIAMGHWSHVHEISTQNKEAEWFATPLTRDGGSFELYHFGKKVHTVKWSGLGSHNMQNALAAIAGASLCGVPLESSVQALSTFISADRRLQHLFERDGIHLYEDFAHHPTAIKYTLDTLKAKYPNHLLIAAIEPRSNTMKSGCHNDKLGPALDSADIAFVYQPTEQGWNTTDIQSDATLISCQNKQELLEKVRLRLTANSVIICMSNGGFDGIPTALKDQLQVA